MGGFAKRIQEDTLVFEISTELYQKEAILSAAHKFTDKYYVEIDSSSEKSINISFRSKDKNHDLNNLALEFSNELLDQQVRLNVEKSYVNIRDLIVKQAFQPIENIQNEIKI